MKGIENYLIQTLQYFSQNALLWAILFLLLLLGLFGLGWLVGKRKMTVIESHNSKLEAALANSKNSAAEKQREASEKSHRLDELNKSHAALKATLVEKEKHFQQQKNVLEEAERRLSSNFENLANKIFKERQKEFSSQSKQSLDSMLDPFKTQLSDFRKRVDEVHSEQTREQASLKTQLESLRDLNLQITDEAAQLTRALKGDKKMQGNWGEMQVEMILDHSGLIKNQEYQREPNFKDEDHNNLRPDFIVNLPDKKRLIIDSKVSLVAFNDFIAAEDETTKLAALSAHTRAVEQHIRSLSNKSYAHLEGMNSPDFVLMFMPIEPAFLVAFQHKQELYNQAFDKGIIVVSPSTLLATLKTVASLWSIERQNKNARILAEQGGKIYDKLRIVLERMTKLGLHLDTAQKTFADVERSLSGQGSLTTTIGKFKELGVRVKKEIPSELLDEAGITEISDEKVVNITNRLESDN